MRWPRSTRDYDFILIDCPPALSMLTLNGLCAAHGVIIPMQCEYYALEGLSDLVNTIKKVHANLNHDLKIIGLLRVMFDPRMTLSQQVSAQLEQHFGDKVFKTIIPRNVRLAEAPSYGMPGRRVRSVVEGRAGLHRVRRRDGRAHQDNVIRKNHTNHGNQKTQGPGPRPRRAARRRRRHCRADRRGAPSTLPVDAAAGRQIPAAHPHGRRRAGRAGRLDQEPGHHAAGAGAPAAATARSATRSSPANGASAPRSWPGWTRSRCWCARSTTRPPPRWR